MSLLVLLNQPAGGQTVSPSGIATAEALGSATVTSGIPAQTVSPSGIGSGEAVGSETWAGNAYYVSTGGNDGAAGTIGAPWRNPRKLIQSMPRYGIGRIRSGTYLETGGFFGSRGEFLIQNYPTETVVIEHNAVADAVTTMFNMENIRGLAFQGGGPRTLGNTGRTVSYDGQATGSLTIRKTGTPAHAGSGTAAAALLRFYYDAAKPIGAQNLYGNADRVRIRGVNFGAVNGYQIVSPNRPSAAHEVNDVVIEGCSFDGAGTSVQLAWVDGLYLQYNHGIATGRMIDDNNENNDNGGVHFVPHQGTHNAFIRYNLIENARATSQFYGWDGGGCEFFGNYDTDVSYNTFVDCEGGVEDGTPNRTSYPMDNNVVHHNIFRGRFAWGSTAVNPSPNDSPVILHRAGTNHKVYNNTFDLTGPHGNAYRLQYSSSAQYNGEIDGARFENNLILLRSADFLIGPTTYGLALEIQSAALAKSPVINHNAIWSTIGDERVAWGGSSYFTRSQLAAFRSATPFADNDVWADPVVLDADGGDYHLEATSPLIDAGVARSPYTDGYLSTAPDIGRWEYETLPLLVSGGGGTGGLEAFGTPVITRGTVTISPSSIIHGEAFGAAAVLPGLNSVGAIASAEAFGTPGIALSSTNIFAAGAIASEEAFGTGLVAGAVTFPTPIGSDEAFGNPVLVFRNVAVEGLTQVRYVTAYDGDYDDADATYAELTPGAGPTQVAAVGQENMGGQVRDHQTPWVWSFEIGVGSNVVQLVEAAFSAYFVHWENVATLGVWDIQIRKLPGSPGAAPYFYTPAELAAFPLVAHLLFDNVVTNTRMSFINDVDLATVIDLTGPPNHFIVVSSDFVAEAASLAEGDASVASWGSGGAYPELEDKLAYEPLLEVSYLVLAEGTLAAYGIASAEAAGGPVLTVGPVTVSPSAIASAEALGAAALVPGAVTVNPSAITTAEAFGSAALTSIYTVVPAAIAGAEAFGTAAAVPGPVTVSPSAIASVEAFGTQAVRPGAVTILPVGIATEVAIGDPLVLGSCPPLSVAELTSGISPNNSASRDTDSILIPAGKPVFVFVATVELTLFQTAGLPVVTGGGVTWTRVEDQLSSNNGTRLSLFRGISASAVSTPLTFTVPGTADAWAWTVVAVTGADASGTGASAAVGNVADDPALQVTLPAFTSLSNGVLAGFAHLVQGFTTLDAEAGYTPTTPQQTVIGAFNLAHRVEWRSTNETTPSMTSQLSGATGRVGVAIELRHCPTTVAVTGAGAIASGETFGGTRITLAAQGISAAGAIATQEAFGGPTLLQLLQLSPEGIASEEAFGGPSLSVGSITVTGRVIAKDIGNRHFFKDRLPRAFRFACAAVNTFIWMDIQLIREARPIAPSIFVDTIDRTDRHTSRIYTISA